jgi:hypothetical protein
MKRGTLTAIVTVVMMLGVPLGALEPGGTFVDDDGSPHEPNIEALVVAGITNGCAPDRFCPDAAVDRGQMAAFLDRALDLPEAPPAPFTDTQGPFTGEIDRLYAAGITTGCGPTTYCPNDVVTRAQMATFIARALGLTPVPVEPRPLPVAGNPGGSAFVPVDARAVDTSRPTTIVGSGTPLSCTAQAVVDAVAAGGIITFDCGPDPVTIFMTQTARVFNNANPDVVIDGGGLVTLSGMGERRILYMNTCDQSLVWTTPRCDDQDHPRLVLQNLTFIDGNATGETIDGGGGGAVFVRGGRVKVVDSRFFSNRCDSVGPDVGGGALRVLSQYNGLPVYVVGSTFGGRADLGNVCSNGGGTSSIGVSWVMINSLLSHNVAIGNGANPARSGTPGGGNGGGIYLDGNLMRLDIYDTVITDNVANEGGGAIFFVSNNRTGTMSITDSVLRANPSLGFETRGLPGIFVLAAAPPTVVNSTIE